MAHFGSGKFRDKVTFFCPGEAAFLLPNEPGEDQPGEISAC